MEVITSWQVLAVTVVLVIYVFIVNSVARLHHRRKHPAMPKIRAGAPEALAATPAEPGTDELGLEEGEE